MPSIVSVLHCRCGLVTPSAGTTWRTRTSTAGRSLQERLEPSTGALVSIVYLSVRVSKSTNINCSRVKYIQFYLPVCLQENEILITISKFSYIFFIYTTFLLTINIGINVKFAVNFKISLEVFSVTLLNFILAKIWNVKIQEVSHLHWFLEKKVPNVCQIYINFRQNIVK